MRFILAIVSLIVLTGSAPMAAPADDAVGQTVSKIRQWIWPVRSIPPSPMVMVPKVDHPIVVAPPKNDPPAIISDPPLLLPPEKPKSKPRTKIAAIADEGPDLPWPCWLVRFHASNKTDAELATLARTNGIVLSPKQRRQAKACFEGF